MEEIWNISLFFKIALIENIREICEKIYISQMQKLKVESIIERYVENKPKSELKFALQTKTYGGNSYTFIEYMSYKLKKYGKKGIAYLNILEEEIEKQGLSLSDVIKKEHFDIALKKAKIGNAIKSIHALQRMNFAEVFESINGVEEILREDPSKVYENMDYKTKECYRNVIKEIAGKTKISEVYIAKKAVELSRKGKRGEKNGHVGYYLIDEGIQDLYLSLEIKKCSFKKKLKLKTCIYIYGIPLVSLIVSCAFGFIMYLLTNNVFIRNLTSCFRIYPNFRNSYKNCTNNFK